eukprot:CAMPEP_0198291878 /NCGR_PEP_ID=MMETSP1449-20131203/9239_1 /TAXON_ID=420275 /ORGANISM="Attheya septentrionalis, Strain CCMP2084" /LENGTH=1751 /DNA_ID=CAMNT_0043990563 /DNA_START=276 /DNA_END=5531 /DNA_ORIENTATION=+
MAIGWYSDQFDSAISPWTTLGPLAVVVSFSLLQEGYTDLSRHRSDARTNEFPCVVLRRADVLDAMGGKRDEDIFNGEDIKVNLNRTFPSPMNRGGSRRSALQPPSAEEATVAFQKIRRKDMNAGDLVIIRNREMVPADIILLASASEGGIAYIETSSIDGETNLKLRTSPQLPASAAGSTVHGPSDRNLMSEELSPHQVTESLPQAIKRITRFSVLGHPDGVSALENPFNGEDGGDFSQASNPDHKKRRNSLSKMLDQVSPRNLMTKEDEDQNQGCVATTQNMVAALTSEPPNPSVNTYSGKLTLPPTCDKSPSVHIPLTADNILLRGAVLRNTEWAIGVACFTGTDTKLVQNSVKTPSKFSQIDILINKTVYLVLFIMLIVVLCLSAAAVYSNEGEFDNLWYAGYSTNSTLKWQYLPDLDAPVWNAKTPNFGQNVVLYITLLNNFVPLSLYITVEVITFALMFFINLDLNMYHEETDTRALARSTIVTDLGQVQYVFSDKTGTLTCNIMKFKRCSVDGMIFGAPIEKAAPRGEEEEDEAHPFHPLRQLLVGDVSARKEVSVAGLEGMGNSGAVSNGDVATSGDRLTFNAEFFLRVMSICHTVVVEKEQDPHNVGGEETEANSSHHSGFRGWVKKKLSSLSTDTTDKMDAKDKKHITEGTSFDDESDDADLKRSKSSETTVKGEGGAPGGFCYQAESPDEEALVSEASSTYDFQLLGRDSSGVRISCKSGSILQDTSVTNGLKSGSLTVKQLAAVTASVDGDESPLQTPVTATKARIETWEVLAVNKFDSDRKRMSVLVRSPPELGSVPMLLCKGADSSMLDPEVCDSPALVPEEGATDEVLQTSIEFGMPPSSITKEDRGLSIGSNTGHLSTVREIGDNGEDNTNDSALARNAKNICNEDEQEWEMSTMLGIQCHIGDFATEGLRTLVLGVRILTEFDCDAWLEKYTAASTSIRNRDEKLTAAALDIERGLHIVGATAIEDKLQDGVPDTISKLEEAGIKLWVLTGDKRETAIEIGYSTKVLTPDMHLTEVAAGDVDKIRTLVAMEFIRLVKIGKLSDYSKSSLEQPNKIGGSILLLRRPIGRFRRYIWRAIRQFYRTYIRSIWSKTDHKEDDILSDCEEAVEEKKRMLDPRLRRKAVRALADEIIQKYLDSPEGKSERMLRVMSLSTSMAVGQIGSDTEPLTVARSGTFGEDDDEVSRSSGSIPSVFGRATGAKELLKSGRFSMSQVRSLSIANLTADEADREAPVVDEDALSLASFVPDTKGQESLLFDKKRRSILERVFAVDREVRHGHLNRHVRKSQRPVTAASTVNNVTSRSVIKQDVPRALVIEGAALSHLLGDPLLEQMIFSVGSSCDAVIACRVSPKQKALLVKMVRNYVSPTPVTLAIGDGANDVGMIQEAHVGVGISGLEGQQAVNSSDFAIAQFRYLQDLLLIHGRWSFMRMSVTVLFSFYKNLILAGLLTVFSSQSLFSGTPIFDMWVISMFNFVAGFPILFYGLFDRDLEREYVLRHPEVYSCGRNNELITLRTTFRWLLMIFAHVATLYFFSVPTLTGGGGTTSGFSGLMSNKDRDVPGDGEGGDLKTMGTALYTYMIIMLGFKILLESKGIINGRWPAFTCSKKRGEGFFNRVAYTWVGIGWLSIGFLFFALYTYQLVGRNPNLSQFSPFTMVTYHTYNCRSLTWMLVLLVPVACLVFDAAGKLFSNMNFPTQNQIHMELASKEVIARKKAAKKGELIDESEAEGDGDLEMSMTV